jgi:tRNA(Ile)-lysidine synthase
MQKLSIRGQFLYFCSMLKEFRKFIETEGLFTPGQRVLLAVSGGLDSIVMTELFRLAGFRYGITHCNFRLRGIDSEKDELFAGALAKKNKVPFFSKRFETASVASKKGISIQMAARELRYEWFREVMETEGFDYVATAHHLDDQVETFFINLMRSTGISGLHGILPKQGKVIRPMLFTTRKAIEEFARENSIAFREDKSNSETKYLRNKIRHEILPVFREISPDFTTHLNENIIRIRDAEKIFHETVESVRARTLKKYGENFSIAIGDIGKLRPAETYLYEFLSPYGFNISQVKELMKMLDKAPGKVILSPTHRLILDRGQILIAEIQEKKGIRKEQEKIVIPVSRKTLSHPLKLSFSRLKKDTDFMIDPSPLLAFFDLKKLEFPLVMRKWKHGDHFYPFGRGHRKKVSDFFIDEKFSLLDKENTWVLCSGNQIAWIVGHRIDNRFRITAKTKEVLRIRLVR